MKKVLIAHQSTIPFYRVPFFNALEARRHADWQFEVVFDPEDKHFFPGARGNSDAYHFSVLNVSTRIIRVGGKAFAYQDFWKRAANYDLLVIENALNNLTYPLCQLHQISGKKVAIWGHGRDRNAIDPSLIKRVAENIKLYQIQLADGFFAYTPGVKKYLIEHGLPADKIFVLNNTIDIMQERQYYQRWISERDSFRQSMGLEGKKILLFVGRMRRDKRVSYLLKAFDELQKIDPSYHLLLMGSGGDEYQFQNNPGITYVGSVLDPDEYCPYFIMSDIYAFPAAVGLGPLQAFCYDLPTVTIHADNHGPEFEYLTPDNSVILPEGSEPHAYAQAIQNIFSTPGYLEALRLSAWNSIQHLTIDSMADRFIDGINQILNVQ